MSSEQNQTKPGMTVEDVAGDTADDLLVRAFVSHDRVAITQEVDTRGAILIAAHAVIAKLDAMETTHLEAMRELLESLDFLGARFDDNAPALTPTAHESEVMYRALEEDYLRSHQAANIDEMDAHLRRFKCLAGC